MSPALRSRLAASHDAILALAHRYDLGLIVLFGSQVSAMVHARSDVDIAVRYRGVALPLGSNELDVDLGAVVGRDVDLVVLNYADPLLLKQVAFNCELIYGSERDFAELQLLAFHRYEDFKPRFRAEADYVKRFIEAHT